MSPVCFDSAHGEKPDELNGTEISGNIPVPDESGERAILPAVQGQSCPES